MNLKRLLGFLAGLFLIFDLSAQSGTLIGRVMEDTAGIGGATISLLKSRKTTVTGSQGFFRMENIAAGKYMVEATVVGFEPVREGVEVMEGKASEISFRLNPIASSLDQVVVSGTMKPVQRKESPILVEVYTPQFLRKNPTPSIFEALQNVNGVRPQLNCNVCNTGDIHINGLEGPYTMITIDGMPIVSSLASVYGLFGIPTQLIERVEIVKGPASGLYGSEAIGGLINIITRSPSKAPSYTANVMTTGWKEHTVDAGFKMKLGGMASTLVGLNYFNYQHPVDKNNDLFTDVTLQHRVSIFKKTSFNRLHDRVMTVAGRFFYEDRWGGDMRWNKSFRGTDSIYGESIYTRRWELIGNYQLPLRDKIMFGFSATGHNQNSYYGRMPYFASQKILFGQLTWDKEIGRRHTSLLGFAGRYNYYDDNSTATMDTSARVNKPEKAFLPGIFIQDEWKINQHHHLLVGVRYDYHSIHKSIFTPRIAYKWAINDRQVIRLNAGTGFRVVSLFTEEHAALTGARSVEVKEALKPEKSYNANLNYSNRITSGKFILNVDASLWYTYFHNQILPDYLTDPNKIVYTNLDGHSISRGMTLNFEGSISRRLKIITGVTIQDVAKYHGKGRKYREAILLTEKWSATWALTYAFTGEGITVDYTGNIYGPMQLPLISASDPRKPESPVWSIQNIQVTKKFSSRLELYGGIKNLLNWTPAKNNPFIIARSHDPFDKKVEFDASGKPIATAENPYALTFDPGYVYAPNQGLRAFLGIRLSGL